jgi:hypothetical protein
MTKDTANIVIITVDNKYAYENQFNEIMDCSPLYISHLIAYSLSSAYIKLQKKKDPKLSAVEFFASSVLDEQEFLSPSQVKIAETNGKMIKTTQEKIMQSINLVGDGQNDETVEYKRGVPISFLSKLEDAILGHMPLHKLFEKDQNYKEIVQHMNIIKKISTTPATESTTEIDWFYYHWIKRMRHILAEEIIQKLLLEHRPYHTWIKRNDENTYLITFSENKLQDKETKKHLRSMEGVLIEAYTRFNRRVSRFYYHAHQLYKRYQKSKPLITPETKPIELAVN